MQQTLNGCRFCETPPSDQLGEARTWGHDDLVTYPICINCTIQETDDPDERGHHTRDGGLIVDTAAALTRFHVELAHLEGTLRFCERCSPGGRATYWTRDLGDHIVSE